MQMSDDEKLMLFLIWWHCDWIGVEMERLTEDYFNHFFNGNEFQRFFSEAHEAKEEFEAYISEFGVNFLRRGEGLTFGCSKIKDSIHTKKIKITLD